MAARILTSFVSVSRAVTVGAFGVTDVLYLLASLRSCVPGCVAAAGWRRAS